MVELDVYLPIFVSAGIGIIVVTVTYFSRSHASSALVQNDLNYIKRDIKESFGEVKDLIKEKDAQWSKSRDMMIEKLDNIGRDQELHKYRLDQHERELERLKYRNGGTKSAI